MYRVMTFGEVSPLAWGWRTVHAGDRLDAAEAAYAGVRVCEPGSVAKALVRTQTAVVVLREERPNGRGFSNQRPLMTDAAFAEAVREVMTPR